MTRYVYDREADCLVEIGSQPLPAAARPWGIIRDIEPYRTVAADVDGKTTWITGRRQHREFLKRNGLVEVGNDSSLTRPRPRVGLSREQRARDIKQAIEQLRNR